MKKKIDENKIKEIILMLNFDNIKDKKKTCLRGIPCTLGLVIFVSLRGCLILFCTLSFSSNNFFFFNPKKEGFFLWSSYDTKR